jgi:hypothetical protein
VLVTFTGPLVESGYYGDVLQFQYYQYNSVYPSEQTLVFVDGPLTVTSDTVSYWISYTEYASAVFFYQPFIAVKVVDITPKSNGSPPGLIFMQLTSISPESYQECGIDAVVTSTSVPEFQADWLVITIVLAVALAFLRIHKSARRTREP